MKPATKDESKKIRLLFILPSLKAGGAERVLSYIAKYINKKRFNVSLLIIGFQKDSVYNVSKCDVIYLNKKRLLFAIIPIIFFLRKKSPNIVLSSVGHINIVMGVLTIFFRKIKFVAREASVISKMTTFGAKKPVIYLKLIKIFYPRFNAIICQSSDMVEDLAQNFKINFNKLILIHNPITQEIDALDKPKRKEVRFITVGRLSKEKGHERILYNLAKIKDYKFHYTIIGDGPLNDNIKKLTKEFDLEKKVTFISFTKKVSEQLALNDVFLQGSYVEGFPNAVLESCVVGTPVLAYNAIGGTKHIVENNVTGFIAQDEDDFLNKLKTINKILKLCSKNISKETYKKFNAKKILNQYEHLFTTV